MYLVLVVAKGYSQPKLLGLVGCSTKTQNYEDDFQITVFVIKTFGRNNIKTNRFSNVLHPTFIKE